MTPTNRTLVAIAAAAALIALGRWSTGIGERSASQGDAHGGHQESASAEPILWTCPMHPQIKLPDFGDCPICGMDLVQMEDSGDDHPRRLVMSSAAKELARIVAEPAKRKNVTRPVRMVGKVDFDETAVRTISAWVAGRLDRLFVDYTGVPVTAGQHLFSLYSPDVLTAQEELLGARELMKATEGEASVFLPTSNARSYKSAREKLLLWGLTEEQVNEIEARGNAEDHVVLTSPSSGVVIEKLVDEGAYVGTGTPVYRVAELDHLWIRLDAYEQDLAWLRHGQEVVLEVEALPGESFEGRITFIDPYIHEHTRTAKVRVNVDNLDGRLKPGMFVRAVAMARLGAGGAVLDRYLAGKWVSPMHPEIVKDGPGQCDVCGMDLVPAEELGLVADAPPRGERPIVLPASAVLVTGKRAVVYVEVPNAERPTYEGREIILGPRAGDEYIVLSGMDEGERVVTHGAFRIDSSMQILAKPSMMSVPGEAHELEGPEATVFRESLRPLYLAYVSVQEALAADELEAALEELAAMVQALEAATAAGLGPERRTAWRELQDSASSALEVAAAATEIEGLRGAFRTISTDLIAIEELAGNPLGRELRVIHCPMAFEDTGADWIQVEETIANPYFGASMLRCGAVTRVSQAR